MSVMLAVGHRDLPHVNTSLAAYLLGSPSGVLGVVARGVTTLLGLLVVVAPGALRASARSRTRPSVTCHTDRLARIRRIDLERFVSGKVYVVLSDLELICDTSQTELPAGVAHTAA